MAKSILCYGDSITWGYNPVDGSRLAPEHRWPRVLEEALQGRARVIEEGLNGRTAATDEPSRPNRNGFAMLPPLLEAHAPLDIVIIMLGTNDSAPCYGLTAGRIALNCGALIRIVNGSLAGPGGAAPQTVLIAPPPLGSLSAEMSLLYAGGQATSRGLAAAYGTAASRFGALFLDAGQGTKVSTVDGVHLDPEGQKRLGAEVAKIVAPLL
ncbi:MAG TPA: SGNH/GDSL hydrolase family protein [Methyloceanibacter sp.]|nr:SGNH/GDSL hydrolase family protein [Methyloceanibacter sp.]